MKTWKCPAAPVPTEETAKITAAAISSFFRPNRSLSTPDPSAPNRQPTKAQLVAQLLDQDDCKSKKETKNGLAPPMTTQS